MGHRVRKHKPIPKFELPTFGYGILNIYDIEGLYGQRLSLFAKVKRLEKELAEMKDKKNSSSKNKQVVIIAAIAIIMIAFCVIVVNPPLVSDRYVLATQELPTAQTKTVQPVTVTPSVTATPTQKCIYFWRRWWCW